MKSVIDIIVGTTQTLIRLPEFCYALLVKNFSTSNVLSINFDNGATMFLDIAAGESFPFDLCPINVVRILEGRPKTFYKFISVVGSASGTIVEIVTADETPSTGIQEEKTAWVASKRIRHVLK